MIPIVSSLKAWILERARSRRFNRALSSFVRSPGAQSDPLLLDRLVKSWGNQAWSSDVEFLAAILRLCDDTSKRVLECGSGLSTILVGATLMRRQGRLYALEHFPEWGARVVSALEREGIDSATVVSAPLHDYGPFEWYRPAIDLASAGPFDLVICDGPPGSTKGGRIGLLACCAAVLKPGALVILDDYERPEERSIAQNWCDEFGLQIVDTSPSQRYVVLQCPREIAARNAAPAMQLQQ